MSKSPYFEQWGIDDYDPPRKSRRERKREREALSDLQRDLRDYRHRGVVGPFLMQNPAMVSALTYERDERRHETRRAKEWRRQQRRSDVNAAVEDAISYSMRSDSVDY